MCTYACLCECLKSVLVYLQVHGRICTCVYLCMWRSEDSLRSVLRHILYECMFVSPLDRLSDWPGTYQVDCLTKKPQESTFLLLRCWDSKYVPLWVPIYIYVLEIKLRFQCLQGNCCTD